MSQTKAQKRTSPQHVRKPGPQEAGRSCAHPECDTVLSRYNQRETCSLHTEAEKYGGRITLSQVDAMRSLMEEPPA